MSDAIIKTEKNKDVIIGRFYELKYKWGQGYKYGYGWINPKGYDANCGKIDIICHDGGVTYQDVENVVFIKLIDNKIII